jgi:hypothetical protein
MEVPDGTRVSASAAQQSREDIHRLVRAAAIHHRPMAALYDGMRRLLCPHVLGHNQPGQWRVFCYQYGGDTKSGPQPNGGEGIWRCLALRKLSSVELLDSCSSSTLREGILHRRAVNHRVAFQIIWGPEHDTFR